MKPAVKSVRDTAALLGVCKATVHNRLRDGTLKSVLCKGRRLVLVSSINALLGEELAA